MIEEQLVNFETAKILKEKEIFIDCFYHYSEYGFLRENSVSNLIYVSTHKLYANNVDFELDRWGGGDKNSIAAPAQSLLQRWLREEHNIIISVVPFYNNTTGICTLDGYTFLIFEKESFEAITNDEDYKTYEEALEFGLKEALKLIKNHETDQM